MKTEELEYRLLFAITVAGKSEKFATNAMRSFFACAPDKGPFEAVRVMEQEKVLGMCIRSARMGNYAKLERAFREVVTAGLDLLKCTPEQMEKVHGIGPKTSRFFILWTRPNVRHAALDTHILKWLRYLGHAAPMSTPSGEKYSALERAFLAECDARKMTPRDVDAQIWEFCRNRLHLTQDWPPILRLRAATNAKHGEGK